MCDYLFKARVKPFKIMNADFLKGFLYQIFVLFLTTEMIDIDKN